MAASFSSRSASNNKWYFTREQIENSPSRRAGLDPDKELSYRQQAANLLQDMGQRLNVSQLTINTAIVYMHRFYMIQSFTRFHRNVIAPATLFLAAKVEEQPRKLEHVIKVTHACLNPQEPSPDTRSDTYLQQAQDLVILESIILQTLAFEITIDHPHTHVVKCTQLVRVVPASKDLAQTSYFMATNSLHLTTFCLQYSPPVVACVCIHLACKWSNWEIPVSTDSKHWWEYVDPTVTLELLDVLLSSKHVGNCFTELTHEFLQILEKTPNRLKRIRNWKASNQTTKKPKVQEEGDKTEAMMNMISMASSGSSLAGLMSLSAPPCGSSSSSSSVGTAGPSDAKERGSAGGSQPWQGGSKEQQPNHEPPAPTRVSLSLSEYRAKHADELAAQKKKLENMEACVKREYATAAQALMGQQRKEKQQQQQQQQQHHHHHQHHQQQQQSTGPHHSGPSEPGNPSPILLKIPLEERQQDRSSLKVRLHPGSGQPGGGGNQGGGSGRGTEQDIKVRIRVPERRGASGEEGKSREKHRERSNHYYHHHHHHHHSSSSSTSSSSSSSAHKHSSSASASASSKKVSGDSMRIGSSSSSRKRTHPSEPSASSHPSKVGKSSRNSYQLPIPSVHGLAHAADMPPPLGLSHHPSSYSHPRVDKADTNGHGTAAGGQSNEYQDTFDMLNSLLSAQGVQPAQPQMFDYHSQYGEYRYSAGSRGGNAQPPPLPSEPPPQMPPLPK
ncbi:cyclin-T1 isoform X3 [Electrophorus electricus]|uniref:cyclin-T1 isoform X3 n=1 Tax=Electrophorus electricus TaxID=8005 RepID=UPI0015D0388D|nr:cyclin-T1 isoform X3 [Electrophorus electricus]